MTINVAYQVDGAFDFAPEDFRHLYEGCPETDDPDAWRRWIREHEVEVIGAIAMIADLEDEVIITRVQMFD
ncbi:hypothetical protein [Sulfobacillus thermosulfidooxidans]|uniref:hypothetical protein n=1 Tax=Sulfobacillus thermosulfidooxidans TaxID=28034 RepID=UPI0006B563E7|nr:hypothetical protein [Sulfobacillus thermosulfidooxidans]